MIVTGARPERLLPSLAMQLVKRIPGRPNVQSGNHPMLLRCQTENPFLFVRNEADHKLALPVDRKILAPSIGAGWRVEHS